MNLTKKTVITWQTAEDADNPTIRQHRAAKVLQMAELGQTNGICVATAEATFERYWIDQAAAQEYIDFITAEANQVLGQVITNWQIQDYTPPTE